MSAIKPRRENLQTRLKNAKTLEDVVLRVSRNLPDIKGHRLANEKYRKNIKEVIND